MRARVSLLTASLLSFSCSIHAVESQGAITGMEDVIAHPNLYNGKRVTLNAWITLRGEDQNLWASWDDHERWETRKCISLMNYDVLSSKTSLLDGRRVKVTGIVRSDASGRGAVIRLAACRDLGLELIDATSVEVADPDGK